MWKVAIADLEGHNQTCFVDLGLSTTIGQAIDYVVEMSELNVTAVSTVYCPFLKPDAVTEYAVVQF